MSMEHKAFVFDSTKYEETIKNILLKCCLEDGISYAKEYISNNIASLKSPYTGEPLDAEWESEFETHTLQEYMDFILTYCYDPSEDIGLAYSWEVLIEALQQLNISSDSEYWIIGRPVILNGIELDPGMMGLGIVNDRDVKEISIVLDENKEIITEFEDTDEFSEDEIEDAYIELCDIYKEACAKNAGLLFTF